MVKKTIIWIILLVLLSSFASADNNIIYGGLNNKGINGSIIPSDNVNATNYGWTVSTGNDIWKYEQDWAGDDLREYINNTLYSGDLGNSDNINISGFSVTIPFKIGFFGTLEGDGVGEDWIYTQKDASNRPFLWGSGSSNYPACFGADQYVLSRIGATAYCSNKTLMSQNINNFVYWYFDLNVTHLTVWTGDAPDNLTLERTPIPYVAGAPVIFQTYLDAGIGTNGMRLADFTIWNGTDTPEDLYPAVSYSINLSTSSPDNGASYFTNVPININFNVTANATNNFNCSLYINSTLNETKSFTSGTNKLINFEKSFPNTNETYNWKITCLDNNFTKSTQTKTFSLAPAIIDNCSVFSTKILNLTLKDENNLSILNGTIEVDLTIAGGFGSLDYSDTVIGNNLLVCLNNISSSTDITIITSYESPTYVKEFWYLDNGTLDGSCQFNSHTSCDVDLHDLPLTDSTTFLFTFNDKDELGVPDAIVHVFRRYIGDGTFIEVERAKLDNNGETHIHLIEEDIVYYFMITKYSEIMFISDSYNAKCIAEPCQIELTASEGFEPFEDDYITIDGTSYLQTDNRSSRMVYLDYNSNASDTINFTLYSYNNNEPVLLNRTFTTGFSGSLALKVPLLYGNATFFTSIHKNNIFVKSNWIDFVPSARDYFGDSGAIFGALILTALGLMAISEGVILIFVVIVAVFLLVALFIIEATWLAISSILCAGAILVWKAMKSRGGG